MKVISMFFLITYALSAGFMFNIPAVSAQEVGDTVLMGKYHYDKDGTEKPIEWIVLNKKSNGTVFLLTKYAIELKSYHNKRDPVTWADCSLRKWLNEEFFDTAFDADEQDSIKVTEVTNNPNPVYGTQGGMDTRDRIFLLSIAQAGKYLDSGKTGIEKLTILNPFSKVDEARVVKMTPYVSEKFDKRFPGASRKRNNQASSWLLRTVGNTQLAIANVIEGGSISALGSWIDLEYTSIRPALWAELTDYVKIGSMGKYDVWGSEKYNMKKESRKADTEMEKSGRKSSEEFIFP